MQSEMAKPSSSQQSLPMTRPRVSIVTATLNMAHWLPETIESVLANMRAGDEYFVIDGGSNDGSIPVLRRYAQRLTGWMSEPDRGYADALHKGFARATGEVLCWINSGDLLARGALDAACSDLQRTGADLIFGDDAYVDAESRIISFSTGRVRSLRWMMLYGGWTPLQDACFWKRSLYERIGGIDPTLRFAADYDFFLRASLVGKCEYVPAVFSGFRRHDGQKSVRYLSEYERERANCRRRALGECGGPAPARWWHSFNAALAVRWHAHVLVPRNRHRLAAGLPFAEIETR
jgi:glycosyltransferase involved in cell wall biosynthesis